MPSLYGQLEWPSLRKEITMLAMVVSFLGAEAVADISYGE